MIKLFLVDDEEIELEGMANYIPWENYGVELVGTAWNGVQAFDRIQTLHPDLVMTDIKMPVMDGLELIRRTKAAYPTIEFVVLSGYGEFDYTSAAMELGVQYYLLKPYDEARIVEVLDKVKAKLAERRQQDAALHAAARLLPRAREQLFSDMLQGRTAPQGDSRLLLKELGGSARPIFVIAFRLEKGFSYLEQYVIGNMMNDLLPPDTMLLTTGIGKDVFVLADAAALPAADAAVKRLRKEFRRFETDPLLAAASEQNTLGALHVLYDQLLSLLHLGGTEKPDAFLRADRLADAEGDTLRLIDWHVLRNSPTYQSLLFQLHTMFQKAGILQDSPAAALQLAECVCRLADPDAFVSAPPQLADAANSGEGWRQRLFPIIVDWLCAALSVPPPRNKEESTFRRLLLAIHLHLQDPELTLQYLARNEFYLSEGVLGRLFTKLQGEKFSTFLANLRIALARELLTYDPGLKISNVAERVGYAPDGQYFSKIFRKVAGMPPSEYIDSLPSPANLPPL